ncbi:unnamed protein product [Rotaria sp. Silwood2]|nr:unnamed protein product [Rotaria sp. Silwood2]CAF2725610.1 unnamed protein product [Rotaria sp. Silwood2]CAF3145038.1 unnamed protein product [Rotaria sp. Silwood2]CAF4149388.1 unnamed protein product [Rotaria sp. Silwood2]CAF4270212.1 unnamed protein product [Rotaria sp. Silwood2]
MLYHVIRRPPNNNTNFSNKSTSNHKSRSLLKLMPRYHYSRIAPHSATTSSESFFPRQNSNLYSSKPTVTTTATSNNNNYNYSPGLFKSTFIPLVTNTRTMTPHKREFIQIPITREDGTSTTNNSIHSIPVTFISETTALSSATNDNSSKTSTKPHYTNLLRPSSRYYQHHSNNNSEESETTVPRLPSVSRRFNLAIPVMTTTTTAAAATTAATTTAAAATATATTTTNDDDDDNTIKQNISPSSTRRIPIRFAPTPNVASIPTNSSRISSAILRSSPLSNPLNNQLQRQKTDLTDTTSSSSDLNGIVSNTSHVRRAEVMAREAIQGIVRFQQQQQQQANSSIPENNNNTLIRSPALSRRVIVNLKNNQSVSLDSRLLSAHTSSTKSPLISSSSRLIQRNNLYHIPVLHEFQMPSHPTTIVDETSLHLSHSPSTSNSNNNNYKNEFHMEIPVTIITRNNQENRLQLNDGREDGIINYDQTTIVTERIPSANTNSNQTLKSILKRSSSRETVSRKNVSFMNA